MSKVDITHNTNIISNFRINERFQRDVSVYPMFMVPLSFCLVFTGIIPTEQPNNFLTDSLKMKGQTVMGNNIKPTILMVPYTTLALLLSDLSGT